MVASFGCSVGAFPQSYLGFSLSCSKLKLDEFVHMIAKVDKFLDGWRARMLSPAGCLILINAVLDSLPTYAMATMRVLPVVVAKLDGLRRAFLWNVAHRASGAHCLVAREHVCRSKAEGGLWEPRTTASFSSYSIASTPETRPGGHPGYGANLTRDRSSPHPPQLHP
ncbi:hypothetical protein ZWY2020_040089 [Hordeum vulgare]|nr:hypothetical protein ZWY2020_040089 [Hordeum vulgare]